RAAAAVEADVHVDRRADTAQQVEIEPLRRRIFPVQVADRGGEGVDPRLLDEGARTVWGREGRLHLLVVDRLVVNVRAAVEIARLALDQGAAVAGRRDHLLGGR